MSTLTEQPQHLTALEKANRVRLHFAMVKCQIRAGSLTIEQAIADPATGRIKVVDLLLCQRRWGQQKADRMLAACGISQKTRAGDLTERQRRELVDRVRVWPRDPYPVAAPARELTEHQQLVLRALRGLGGEAQAFEAGARVGLDSSQVSSACRGLVSRGLVRHVATGRYALIERVAA